MLIPFLITLEPNLEFVRSELIERGHVCHKISRPNELKLQLAEQVKTYQKHECPSMKLQNAS